MKRIAFVTASFLLISASLSAQDDSSIAADSVYVEAYDSLDNVFTITDSVFQNDDDSDDDAAYGYVDPKDTKAAQTYMKEDVHLRKFDEKKWKDVVGDLTYDEKAKKQEEARKSRSWGFPGFAISPGLLQAISFIVVFVLFAFILYYVSKNTSLSQSIKNMKQGDVSGPLENIEELDTEDLLRQALANGDLRLAVRVHYLLLLKKLNEVGLIAWKKDKTNRDYLSELYGRNSCYEDVRNLTLAYEMVWYGERSVSSDSFQRLSGEFESVNRQITQVRPNT